MLTLSENDKTFELVMKAFVEASEENHDYAYTAGYLSSFARDLFSVLPKTKQRMFIAALVRATAKQEAEVIEKRNKKQMLERA